MERNELQGTKQLLILGYCLKARSTLQKRAKLNGKKCIPEELFIPIEANEIDEKNTLSFAESLKVVKVKKL